MNLGKVMSKSLFFVHQSASVPMPLLNLRFEGGLVNMSMMLLVYLEYFVKFKTCEDGKIIIKSNRERGREGLEFVK